MHVVLLLHSCKYNIVGQDKASSKQESNASMNQDLRLFDMVGEWKTCLDESVY